MRLDAVVTGASERARRFDAMVIRGQRRIACLLTHGYDKLRFEVFMRRELPLDGETEMPVARNILLVEPEPVVAEISAFRLELLGYHVECVDSGEQALSKIAAEIPDLLITDLVLPGLDGMGLIERLTTDEDTADLPIMVLSIDADLARVQAVFAVGAKDFLVVPFDLDVLQEKVERLLKDAPVRTPKTKPEDESQEAEAVAEAVAE